MASTGGDQGGLCDHGPLPSADRKRVFSSPWLQLCVESDADPWLHWNLLAGLASLSSTGLRSLQCHLCFVYSARCSSMGNLIYQLLSPTFSLMGRNPHPPTKLCCSSQLSQTGKARENSEGNKDQVLLALSSS